MKLLEFTTIDKTIIGAMWSVIVLLAGLYYRTLKKNLGDLMLELHQNTVKIDKLAARQKSLSVKMTLLMPQVQALEVLTNNINIIVARLGATVEVLAKDDLGKAKA